MTTLSKNSVEQLSDSSVTKNSTYDTYPFIQRYNIPMQEEKQYGSSNDPETSYYHDEYSNGLYNSSTLLPTSDNRNVPSYENKTLLFSSNRSNSDIRFNCSQQPLQTQQTRNSVKDNWSETILQQVSGLLHVLSPEGRILYCSESCIEMTGYFPYELVGEKLAHFIHSDDLDLFIQNFQTSFQTLTRVKSYYRLRCKNNRYLLLESIGGPKQDRPQTFFGIAQPCLSESSAVLSSYLKLQTENEWLKNCLNSLLQHKQQPDVMDCTPPPTSTVPFMVEQPPPQETMPQQLSYQSPCFENSSLHPQQQQFMDNNNSPRTTSRRPSACSSIKFHQINKKMAQPQNVDDSVYWSTNKSQYNNTPSVASSTEFNNDILVTCQQEEHTIQQNSNTNSLQSSPIMSNLNNMDSSTKSDKWKKKRKQKRSGDYVCNDCGTNVSPEWRKGPLGPKTLCNACGLRWAKKNKKV